MYMCDVCKTGLNSEMQLYQHKIGKIHKTNCQRLGIKEEVPGPPPPNPDPPAPASKNFGIRFIKPGGLQGQGQPGGQNNWYNNKRGRGFTPRPQGFNSNNRPGQMTSHYGQTGQSQNGGAFATNIGTYTGLSPVERAIVDNAMGKISNKRKPFVSKISKCEMCDVAFNSDDQQSQHYSGKKHNKKAKLTEIEKDLEARSDTIFCDPGVERLGNAFYCKYCNVNSNSIGQFEQHLSGVRHLRKVKAANVSESELNEMKKKVGEVVIPETKSFERLFVDAKTVAQE